jgi:hypothetical protein
MTDNTTLIKNAIKFSINKNNNPFINILDILRSYYEKPVNNILEFKRKTTKNKGDIFEDYCVMYLNAKYPHWTIYKLKDIPQNLLNEYNLKRFDTGIDLIAINTFTTSDKVIKFKDINNNIITKKIKGKTQTYKYAIQCKYRKPNNKKEYSGLTWKSLSTFYATCSRTGGQDGWSKHIVMTTADYVRRFGRKNIKDWTIAKNTFMNTKREVYDSIIGDVLYKLNDSQPLLNTQEPLQVEPTTNTPTNNTPTNNTPTNNTQIIKQRNLREAFLNKLNINK